MKVSRLFVFLVSFLIIFFSAASLLVTPSFAQTQTTFISNLATNATSANSNLNLDLSVPEGTILANNVDINMPAGWDVKGGTDVAQGVQVASGTAQVNYLGTIYNLSVSMFNEQTTEGAEARWKVVIGDEPFTLPEGILYWSWTGSVATGYVFNVNSPIIADLATPLVLNFTFFGTASSGQPVLVNPAIGGDYIWSVDLNYAGGAVTTLPISFPISATATGSVDGTLTDTGNKVTNTFDLVTVVYNRVTTEGSTTLTTTTTAPSSGTGQFQPSGGLYYDFNTTATIACPCTVTIPYDPVTTPDPRIYHLEDGVWVDATTGFDSVAKTVTGRVSSFSFFAVGEPNYSVDWQKKIEKFLEKEDNPFDIKEDKKLKIEFGLLDASGQPATPENVTVEIWQIMDEAGNPVDPTKVATLTPDLKEKKDQFKAELNLRKTELALGTYEIRVIVENTTASQTPETASFTVIEKR